MVSSSEQKAEVGVLMIYAHGDSLTFMRGLDQTWSIDFRMEAD